MDFIDWIIIAVATLIIAATVELGRRAKRWTLATAEATLEVISMLRLVMQDAASNQPQIAEHMELGVVQLDDYDRRLRDTVEASRPALSILTAPPHAQPWRHRPAAQRRRDLTRTLAGALGAALLGGTALLYGMAWIAQAAPQLITSWTVGVVTLAGGALLITHWLLTVRGRRNGSGRPQ